MSAPGFWQRRWMKEHERFLAERDRRLTEVAAEKQKALEIKHRADETALNLSRDAQKYRDEQANKLREQINSERNLYASKADLSNTEEKLEALVQPALVAMQQAAGSTITRAQVVVMLTVAVAVISLVVAVANGRV